MKFFKGVFLAALMAAPLVGFAEEAVTNAYWKSNLSLGATYRDGNTEKSLFTMNLRGDRFGKHNDVINSLYAEYGKTEGNQTEGQVRGQSEYRHKFGESRFFAGAFGEVRHDSIKQIRFLGRLGPSIGYYFIDKEKMKLDATAGLNYAYERTSSLERDYGEYRLAANYFWDFIESSRFYFNIEYSANVEDSANDNSGLLVSGLKTKMSEQFSLFIELRDEYDNSPAIIDPATGQRADNNDVTIIAGLSYDF